MSNFEILGKVRNIETIAVGRGVRIRRRLNQVYGSGRWRKRKGEATIQMKSGAILDVELHWFEAHGIGRRDVKIKRVLR